MNDEVFKRQVDLLLDVLTLVMKDNRFALKGGTAINLFNLDMPRLSVDIDLTYLPIEDRKTSYLNIHQILATIKSDLEKLLNCRVSPSKSFDGNSEIKLLVMRNGTQIKIEPNYVLRGSIFPPVERTLSPEVVNRFRKTSKCICLSSSELYGGKICAALDRQHPRDLFDMMIFFETFSWTRELTQAFIFHLVSHNRPIHELLEPRSKSLTNVFDQEFAGMTLREVSLDQLEATRLQIVSHLRKVLTNDDKEFLMSVAKGEPLWAKFGIPIQNFPSIQWKLHNIQKMNAEKKMEQLKALETSFNESV